MRKPVVYLVQPEVAAHSRNLGQSQIAGGSTLPVHQTIVRDDSIVVVNGNQYTDPLLSSWCGQPVEVRVSQHDLSQVYVYLNGAILCLAQEKVERQEPESPTSAQFA